MVILNFFVLLFVPCRILIFAPLLFCPIILRRSNQNLSYYLQVVLCFFIQDVIKLTIADSWW